ncbi:MAG: acyl-CoA dehydrogenase family protein [Pseudonocardia sp.]
MRVDAGVVELAASVRAFVDEVAVPAEAEDPWTGHGIPDDLVLRLRAEARRRGLWAPTAPVGLGGLGLDHRSQSVVLEEAGRSLLGPTALNCAAPDEGNILLLDKVATESQKERYLAPLVAGELRSAFAMTEPSPGAGADPDMLLTTAERRDGRWLVNGRKWFITGASGAGFYITMARTGDRATMFLVDADVPGVEVVRAIDTLDRGFAGGHCEMRFDGVEVGDEAVLGEVDEGFRYAQVRLGPARLTHCMRWLGAARRAHETAVAYAAGRPMFGSTLGELGMAQQMIADNEIDIAASRALIWQAACALDEELPARQETSVAKAFVAEAVYRVVDRSLQLCGGFGVSGDSPIQRIFKEMRPFRVYDGPTEVHRMAIARRAVRRSTSGRLPGDRS